MIKFINLNIPKGKENQVTMITSTIDYLMSSDVELIDIFKNKLYIEPKECECYLEYNTKDYKEYPLLKITTSTEYSNRPILLFDNTALVNPDNSIDIMRYHVKYSLITNILHMFYKEKNRDEYFNLNAYFNNRLNCSDNIFELIGICKTYCSVYTRLMEEKNEEKVWEYVTLYTNTVKEFNSIDLKDICSSEGSTKIYDMKRTFRNLIKDYPLKRNITLEKNSNVE